MGGEGLQWPHRKAGVDTGCPHTQRLNDAVCRKLGERKSCHFLERKAWKGLPQADGHSKEAYQLCGIRVGKSVILGKGTGQPHKATVSDSTLQCGTYK